MYRFFNKADIARVVGDLVTVRESGLGAGRAAWAGFVTDRVLPAARSGGLDNASGRFGSRGASLSRPRWTRARTLWLRTGHSDLRTEVAERRDRAAGRAQPADRGDARLPCDDQGGRADRAQLVVLACQYGLAALPARDDEITSSTRARQSSR
jgi:hypothetical protein